VYCENEEYCSKIKLRFILNMIILKKYYHTNKNKSSINELLIIYFKRRRHRDTRNAYMITHNKGNKRINNILLRNHKIKQYRF